MDAAALFQIIYFVPSLFSAVFPLPGISSVSAVSGISAVFSVSAACTALFRGFVTLTGFSTSPFSEISASAANTFSASSSFRVFAARPDAVFFAFFFFLAASFSLRAFSAFFLAIFFSSYFV